MKAFSLRASSKLHRHIWAWNEVNFCGFQLPKYFEFLRVHRICLSLLTKNYFKSFFTALTKSCHCQATTASFGTNVYLFILPPALVEANYEYLSQVSSPIIIILRWNKGKWSQAASILLVHSLDFTICKLCDQFHDCVTSTTSFYSIHSEII